MSTDASNRANSWAAQRKQAIDKAKQGRDERKFNLAKAGEMSVANEMTSGHLARVTSSENHNRDYQKPPMPDFPLNSKKPATMKYGMSLLDQQPTEEELIQARTSLRLLKSKMKDSNGFPTMARTADQYMEHGQGDRRTGQNYNNYNDSDQSDNRNYRKVFKPSFKDGDYDQMNNNLNRDLNQIDKTLSQKGRGSNAGMSSYANYQPQNNDPPQQSRIRDNAKPPIGTNRNVPDASRNIYDNSQEDFRDFSSKNIPSRIPKQTMSANKAKPSSMYDDDYSLQFNNKQQPPKYQGSRNYMDSDSPPPRKNHQDYDYRPQQQQPQYNKLQENPLAKNNYDSGFNKLNNMNKGWPNNVSNSNAYNNSRQPYDDRDNDNNAVFSKPNLKKAQPTVNQQQNSRPSFDDNFDNHQKGKSQPPMNSYPNSRPSANDDDNRPLKGTNDELPSEFAKTGPLQECPMGCGRSFNADAIEKHAKICQKIFQSKRKKFDSSEQRQSDEAEMQYESKYNPPKSYKPPAKAGAAGGKSAKWKQQSEAFRANMKAARGAPLSQEEQVKLAQANTDHLVLCPCCGRKFNENAAARHIPFCESKQKVDTFKKGGKAKK